jgi:hypothetical protein
MYVEQAASNYIHQTRPQLKRLAFPGYRKGTPYPVYRHCCAHLAHGAAARIYHRRELEGVGGLCCVGKLSRSGGGLPGLWVSLELLCKGGEGRRDRAKTAVEKLRLCRS